MNTTGSEEAVVFRRLSRRVHSDSVGTAKRLRMRQTETVPVERANRMHGDRSRRAGRSTRDQSRTPVRYNDRFRAQPCRLEYDRVAPEHDVPGLSHRRHDVIGSWSIERGTCALLAGLVCLSVTLGQANAKSFANRDVGFSVDVPDNLARCGPGSADHGIGVYLDGRPAAVDDGCAAKATRRVVTVYAE